MSIAAAVLDAVRAESGLHGGAHVARAGLRIGELSGVEPESLRFCLETLVFDLEIRPWTRRCRDCGAQFRVLEYNPACAACGSARTEAAGGDEMELSYLELEDPACASRSNEKS
jgi:hydrogenase nickel incorporation protein HypA/HybF